MKEVQQRPVRRMIVDTVTCDRCGKDGLCTNGTLIEEAVFGRSPWGIVDGLIQGGQQIHADLCRRCVLDLEGWINEGNGPGVERGP